jgi:uncharacterized lipoprotein NlpE involved in copper resistance
MIKRRDSVLSRFKRNRQDGALYKEYCMLRNRVQKMVKKAKQDHFDAKVNYCKGDTKKTMVAFELTRS